jgi:hypothetical protein
VSVWVVDHEIERELFEHDFFVRENAIPPSPIFLTLLVYDELGILLGDLCNCDYDVLCLTAVLLGLIG